MSHYGLQLENKWSLKFFGQFAENRYRSEKIPVHTSEISNFSSVQTFISVLVYDVNSHSYYCKQEVIVWEFMWSV